MPRLRVTIVLPYFLRLREGEYLTEPDGRAVRVVAPPLLEGTAARTSISEEFETPKTGDRDEQFKHRARAVDRVLADTNRLLRWYRAVSQQAEIVELTRAQASPFRFEVLDGSDPSGWVDDIKFESEGPRSSRIGIDALTTAVRTGFEGSGEPEVADLALLDAERAIHEGRFREAVLFCWSTIDAVFNRKYDQLVGAALAEEWQSAREFFTGVDFGLKNKMTAVMHLVAKRSFFREPGHFWQQLTVSYQKRNNIIHRGETASEDEARLALDVAGRVVAIMKAL